ncbi:MAG: MucR family transcriptional regulator [Magnetococcales bacterium]|nr:MucR family transcriptional regulator [Magnetococcales bacterium]
MSAAEQTVRILEAYLSGNQSMNPGELPGLISSVHEAVTRLADPSLPQFPPKATAQPAQSGGTKPSSAQPAEEKAPVPVIAIEQAVTEDTVTCLLCGKPAKTLKRHITTAHGMNDRTYRAKLNLPKDFPLVAPSYSKIRKEAAIRNQLGEKMKAARAAKRKG